MPDRLRDPVLTDAEAANIERQEDEQFEETLPLRVKALQKQRRKTGLEEKDANELEDQLKKARVRRRAAEKKGAPAQRFVRWVRASIVEGFKSTIQAMFYACDYSTKPNMTCAPLLVADRDGIRRLEDQLKKEEEEAQRDDMLRASDSNVVAKEQNSALPGRRPLTKLEDEARRRLIRQATAANQAIVKGNCLMVMQMMTGREALRTHYSWQLMMKHSMWMAFQHRRQLQGFDERERQDEVMINAAALGRSDDDEDLRKSNGSSKGALGGVLLTCSVLNYPMAVCIA